MLSRLAYSASVLLAVAVSVHAGIGPSATLTVANANISPDGFTRAASVINGGQAAPLITARKGDKLQLNVVNKLSDPLQERGTSIHWHGIFQRGTNFMDGTEGVTQCPIAPGNSFLYSFAANQTGTYWYHSHFGLQYCDGVRGPLVIYDPQDPLQLLYDIDDDSTVITLSEWYHAPVYQLTGIAAPDSTLINGKGRFPGGPAADLAVVNVQKGKRYRLRLISMSCDPSFMFSIDGHTLLVIEADGAEVLPVPVNSVNIFAGQRYSMVLTANQSAGNYWIRALPSTGNGNLTTTFDGGVNSAILRYKGAPIAEPTTTRQSSLHTLSDASLHPITSPFPPGKPTPNGADLTVNLTFGFDPNALLFTVNGVTYQPPTVPVLLQILSGARSAQELLPSGGVITVPRNAVIQVNVPGGLFGGPHPFHLHGHQFTVVRPADTGYYNFLDPVRRDVYVMGDDPNDFFSFRFTTDNPGPWIFHCHIDFHLAAGLAIVFAEAPDQTPAANTPPPAWNQLCPNWNALPASVKQPQIGSS